MSLVLIFNPNFPSILKVWWFLHIYSKKLLFLEYVQTELNYTIVDNATFS
jgi:hypothetical protein